MDYYGQAKQPQTFNPLVLNTQHFRRMADIDGGHASYLRLLVARRVPWRWRCDVRALFKPIAPLQEDARTPEQTVRTKWDGATGAPLGASLTLQFWGLWLCALGASVFFLLTQAKLEPPRALLGALLSLALLVLVCRGVDQHKGYQASIWLGAALVAPTLGLLTY